jgi:hypothetical protein
MHAPARIGTLVAAIVTLVAATGLSNAEPASAATRHDWAVGAGKEAREWVDAGQYICTVSADYAVAQSAAQANQGDAVVLRTSDLHPDSSGVAHITWGAGQPLTAKQLFLRFAKPIGCFPQDVTIPQPTTNFAVPIPPGTAYVVVSASEGTVQPWFSA